MTEIKKLIASRLILWAFSICPEGIFKRQFALFLKDNIMNL